MKIIFLLSIFILTSCASYVNKVHNQIKRDQYLSKGKNPRQKKFYDPYNGYRGIPVDKRDARPIRNPLTLGGPQQSNPPAIKRKYSKRYTAEDLRDNSNNASLWGGDNKDTFLFVTNTLKRRGDVVIIEVQSKLKENITAELKRAFPEPKKKKSSKDDKKDEGENKEAESTETKTASTTSPEKVFDKISSVVTEEINKDYLMVRGRKEVLFKEKKRYVEISALVSRKNIKDNDSVSSSSLLEPKVRALRYKK